MGFLHEGHLSLVDGAREQADVTAVSVFVNPLQFGEGEDLDRYPRDLDRDLGMLSSRGADLVFAPDVQEMYPHGEPVVTVDPGPMATRLCGAYRPGHFRGVLTVVARLFGLIRPDLAVFGQKDYQQSVLIRRMTTDLDLGVQIVVAPVVREADGLAMSSRNVFLSPTEREDAVGIRRGLLAVQESLDGGTSATSDLLEVFHKTLGDHPLLRLQYGEIVDPDGLENVDRVEAGSVLVVAAHCGSTRLIDNHILEP